MRLLQGGDPFFEAFAPITAIDPQFFQAWDAPGKVGAQHAHQPVSIGRIGRGHPHPDHQPQGIDQGMPFTPLDLFAGVVTLGLLLGCRLDTLTIHTTGRRGRLASLSLALALGQRLQHLLPTPGSAPTVEVAIHRFPSTKLRRQHAPLTAGLGYIQNAIDHLPSRTRRSTRSTRPPWTRRQQRLQELPLRVGQIGRIFSLRTHWAPFALGFFVEPKGGLVSTSFQARVNFFRFLRQLLRSCLKTGKFVFAFLATDES